MLYFNTVLKVEGKRFGDGQRSKKNRHTRIIILVALDGHMFITMVVLKCLFGCKDLTMCVHVRACVCERERESCRTGEILILDFCLS